MAFNQNDDSDEGINEINITPFVDVVLVLLVIFMIATPAMVKQSLKVQLPKSLESEQMKQTSSKGIAITKEGQLIFEGQLISKDALIKELSIISQNAPMTQFLISADADSLHHKLIEVIDLLKGNGLNQFALQVEKIKANDE